MSGGETSGDGSGGGTMGSLGGPTGPNPADKAKQDALYEDREPKKIIRIITVSAYMVSVSFVGIVLSIYYIFLWHPPNPRLMHAQAISAHSEALRADDDSLMGAAARIAAARPEVHTLSLLDTSSSADDGGGGGDQSLKIRREIVRNVNAMMRANFERSRESQQQEEERLAEAMLLPTANANVVALNSALPLNNTADTLPSSTAPSPTSVPSQEPSASAAVEESSTMTTGTILPPSRKSKGPAKKQHQTPFALKHLQEPIKADGSPRRRPVRPTTRSGLTAASGTEAAPTAAATTSLIMQIPRKMSAHNVMASISRTLGTRHAEGKPANEVKLAGEESKDKLYEPKHKQKLVRVLTVVAYIISVSLAAIVLSLYYMYIWDPSDHTRHINKPRNSTSSSSVIMVTAAAAVAGTSGITAKTPCLEVVTPAMETTAEGGNNVPSSDKSTTPGHLPTMTPATQEVSIDGSSPSPLKSLYKTLTTPRDNGDYTSGSTDVPVMPSISSDQFQAAPRDYVDTASVTMAQPDLLDD